MKLTGLELRVAAPEVDEKRQRDESPRDMTRRLALAKAKAVEIRGGLVLGADTVVVDGFEVLGKPENSNGARQMLEALRGRSHQVVTSIAFFNPETGSELVDTCESNVPMRQYSDSDLEQYLVNGNPLDMKDCFANVMGLPLCHVARTLPLAPLADVPAACQAHTGYQCPIYSDVLEGRL
jgi:MAF protein